MFFPGWLYGSVIEKLVPLFCEDLFARAIFRHSFGECRFAFEGRKHFGILKLNHLHRINNLAEAHLAE